MTKDKYINDAIESLENHDFLIDAILQKDLTLSAYVNGEKKEVSILKGSDKKQIFDVFDGFLNIDTTLVQMELGEAATPFEKIPKEIQTLNKRFKEKYWRTR